MRRKDEPTSAEASGRVEGRRRFLSCTGVLGLSLAIGTPISIPASSARAAVDLTESLRGFDNLPLRVASNPGLENATLNALMTDRGYFEQFSVAATIIEVDGVAGPFEAVSTGAADICMVSGYSGVMRRIARGAQVKIIGAGMRKPGLAVFARPAIAQRLSDLVGKTIAVGPSQGLLQTLMRQLLHVKGIDAASVHFMDKGSNEQCYAAVLRGEADACCASISHLDGTDGLDNLKDANLWDALPGCVFQTAFAADRVIASRHADVVSLLAAYGALYNYLMSPISRNAFFEARRRAQHGFDATSARAVWNFYQNRRPYTADLTMTPAEIDYLQQMYIDQGELDAKVSFDALADMTAATAAAKRL